MCNLKKSTSTLYRKYARKKSQSNRKRTRKIFKCKRNPKTNTQKYTNIAATEHTYANSIHEHTNEYSINRNVIYYNTKFPHTTNV